MRVFCSTMALNSSKMVIRFSTHLNLKMKIALICGMIVLLTSGGRWDDTQAPWLWRRVLMNMLLRKAIVEDRKGLCAKSWYFVPIFVIFVTVNCYNSVFVMGGQIFNKPFYLSTCIYLSIYLYHYNISNYNERVAIILHFQTSV